MSQPARPAPVLRLAVLLGLALLAAPAARAEDEPEPPAAPPLEKLEAHPLADAKPGELLRFMTDKGGWKKWFVERVIDVKEGKVLLEIAQTNEDGTQDLGVAQPARWIDVPPRLQKGEHQEILEDEMVVLEVDGKQLRCRHLYIEEPLDPIFAEPRVRRHVWYSNDVPGTGKVKEDTTGRMVVSWGMMSPEELERRQKAFQEHEQGGDEGGGGSGS